MDSRVFDGKKKKKKVLSLSGPSTPLRVYIYIWSSTQVLFDKCWMPTLKVLFGKQAQKGE